MYKKCKTHIYHMLRISCDHHHLCFARVEASTCHLEGRFLCHGEAIPGLYQERHHAGRQWVLLIFVLAFIAFQILILNNHMENPTVGWISHQWEQVFRHVPIRGPSGSSKQLWAKFHNLRWRENMHPRWSEWEGMDFDIQKIHQWEFKIQRHCSYVVTGNSISTTWWLSRGSSLPIILSPSSNNTLVPRSFYMENLIAKKNRIKLNRWHSIINPNTHYYREISQFVYAKWVI